MICSIQQFCVIGSCPAAFVGYQCAQAVNRCRSAYHGHEVQRHWLRPEAHAGAPRRWPGVHAPRRRLPARLDRSAGRARPVDSDQRAQTHAWVKQRGWHLVAEYVEPGASATDDKRPEFQRMIERACDGEQAFDVIVVHSFSRFFRDAFGLEFYVRKLTKHGVRLVSITQELGDDPAQIMMRQVIALFDEYQSKENAKRVLRAMKENARQGFWNGSLPPFGYTTVEAERRGARVKKKLVIDHVEAEQVQLIFRLFLDGDEQSGPMGIKAIATWLNERSFTTRTGGRWGNGRVHALLRNPVYSGRLRFNVKDSRTHRVKSASEHVYCDAPVILGSELFDRAQALLTSRSPRVTHGRIIGGQNLLTGLAVCASCRGGAGSLTPITSRHCWARWLNGMRSAQPRSTGALLLWRGRPRKRTRGCGASTSSWRTAGARDDLLNERIADLKLARSKAHAALERAKSGRGSIRDDRPILIERFTRTMRERLSDAPVQARKALLGSLIDRVEVDDSEVRIVGRKEALERAIMASRQDPGKVHSFVPNWRPRQDLNLRPSD